MVGEKLMHIAIGYNTSHYIWLLRANLIRALLEGGYRVTVLAPRDDYTERLKCFGVDYCELPMKMDRNPFADLLLMLRFRSALHRIKPDLFLGYTAKPNIYGSLAAQSIGIPVINNIAGLGTAFLNNGWLTRVVKVLYRLALSRSACVFFQNRDDRDLFVRCHLVRPEQVRLLPGSGVDLKHFAPAPSPQSGSGDGPVFILIARLLWDKGVGEFVEAARFVRKRFPQARFRLLGFLDVENRSAVPRGIVESWVSEGIVEYLGQTDDVRPFIAAADCVVLPSYREGTPRSLLEAAAMGKPLITTNTPGCRDVVEDGVNGWLCRVKDAKDLAEAMLRFCSASDEQRTDMGRQSRLKAEREFDENIVIEAYFDVINRIVRQETVQSRLPAV